jgi:hypothetical protein
MSFLKALKGWLGLDSDSKTSPQSVSREKPLFVYVKLPCDIGPIDRGERFEDPLQERLEQEKLGTVTGGGSQLSEPDAEGRRTIEFCGIDVDLYDAVRGLTLIRNELARLKAPPGTLLLYELDGHEWQEPLYRIEN